MPTGKRVVAIFKETIPIILMISFIPLIQNDYILTVVYLAIIAFSFFLKTQKKDWIFFAFGFFVITASETLFISTGVETFQRKSLFGLMPFWLPFLWAYAFVAMRRAIVILDE